MEIVYLIAGIALGAIAGAGVVFIILRGRNAATHALLASERHNLETLKQEHKEYITTLKEEHAQQVKMLKEEHAQQIVKVQQNADMQRAKELETLRHSYEEQLKLFKAELTTATEKMLKERSGELQQSNTQKMDELFKPIRENITRMEQSMNANREANARNTASFEQTIKLMIENNNQLSEQAERLSTALLRKNKTAGNWGELILTELLEGQGLIEGTHFHTQQTLRGKDGEILQNEDSGSRMIPDVVLHLADNRDVIVDSKVSLAAFVDYQNAETELEKQDALKRHLASVRRHISELSGKNYSDYIVKPRKSANLVIMFVPIEAALQLAMSEEPKLWREAFDKNVFLASGQTLIAALRIIDLTWANVLQERNTQKIMDEARKLIDRVAAFYTEFQAVGRKLEDATKAYNTVQKRVDEGQQSILSTGRRLETLGARGKKSLPNVVDDIEEIKEEA